MRMNEAGKKLSKRKPLDMIDIRLGSKQGWNRNIEHRFKNNQR